jgi:hypothetical protein
MLTHRKREKRGEGDFSFDLYAFAGDCNIAVSFPQRFLPPDDAKVFVSIASLGPHSPYDPEKQIRGIVPYLEEWPFHCPTNSMIRTQ